MSDPATEAARRAGTDDEGDYMGPAIYNTPFDYGEECACEALAPIRARIQALDAAQETFRGDSLDYHDLAQSAIEDIRDLCFTSEELDDE